MSYIRSGSNPEGLYIISSGTYVTIWHCMDAPRSSKAGKHGAQINIPQSVFNRVFKKWKASGDEPVTYKGLTLREEWVFLDTWKPVPPAKSVKDEKARMRRQLKKIMEGKPSRPTACLVRLEYEGQWFRMWDVTCAFICSSVE